MKNHRDNSVMVVNKWKMYQNLYRTILHSKTLHIIIHQIVSVRVRQQFSQRLNVDWRKFCMFVQVVQYVQRRRLLQIFRQAAIEAQSYRQRNGSNLRPCKFICNGSATSAQ